MIWLQASVTFVPHVVVLLLPVLRTAVVVFGCSSTTGNTFTSHTLTNTVILTNTFPLMVSMAGLVRNERACPALQSFLLVLLDMIVYLCLTIASVSARVMLSLYKIARAARTRSPSLELLRSSSSHPLQVNVPSRILSTRAKNFIGSSFFSVSR